MTSQQDVIVIVEDNPDDRDLLARAFRKAKVTVPIRFANDGEEAISLLSGMPPAESGNARPVVVLLDLKLPGRSGFEVLDWIKGHQALRLVPVVILTSSRESVDIERAYSLGANSYLVKPAGQEALLRMVAQIDGYWLGLNEAAALDRSRS